MPRRRKHKDTTMMDEDFKGMRAGPKLTIPKDDMNRFSVIQIRNLIDVTFEAYAKKRKEMIQEQSQ